MNRIDAVRARFRGEAMQRGVNPRDVDVLISDLAGRSLAWVFAHGDERVDDSRLEESLKRRYAGEPLQYIRGKADFYSREFLVDDRVLIPRPETELLVEAAVARAPGKGRVIDIGTGSGCIAISIERERPDLRVTGLDVSIAALALASRNRDRLQSRVNFVTSDLLSAIETTADLIVSNPPYIPEKDVESLQPEVRDHEPALALSPGPRGTEIIERVLEDAHAVLGRSGQLMMEIGFGQENVLRELSLEKGWRVERFIPDLAGIARVIVLSADAE